MAGIKRTAADIAFSDCVRERADWHCEHCEKHYPEGSSRAGLHCSHHFGRRHKSVRWEPLNAASLCFSCHNKMGESPLEHVVWFSNRIGAPAYGVLCELKERVLRRSEYDIKDIAKHYREQLKVMRGMREAGETGRVEFEGYF